MVFKHPNFYETKPEIEIEFPNRAVLESAVSDALASAGGLDASDVTVIAEGSEVALAGSVFQVEEINRAEEVALSVAGVTAVRNAIQARSDFSQPRTM
ncbi:BON domain-containing protein [Neorhizobium alkalisoli]|uniref:BON domain-containing protein n=1 Tax=Neorhizobium alkalisoli TaxID=528178 RepID=A0A561QP99_9HYPH|nr:BON domain-containing protein [Neorhizobium alkalisoli]TWF52159.1 BON domain-containing protein [Neorhizobium alkalisoli]